MAETKSPNTLMIIIAVAVIILFIVILLSKREPKYSQMHELPSFDQSSQPKDGDTQADTIRALQAYAKEAVSQAETLNEKTRQQQTTVLENRNKVSKLEKANAALAKATEKMTAYNNRLESELSDVKKQLDAVKEAQEGNVGELDEHGIPVGFGFDGHQKRNQEVGDWHDPIDIRIDDQGDSDTSRFTGLLTPPGKTLTHNAHHNTQNTPKNNAETKTDKPVFTLPKDSILYDGIALTALIGRIPVEGTTPDPYPVKILIGKENLAASGFDFPEVDGMLFSGLGVGDWNLSCVNARLYSATYIFEDGSIVNHTTDAKPLGYLSDRHGWPCVVGKFKTNAPAFLRDRVGLAGINAAGAAYANAQFSRRESELTGQTTTSFTGTVDKLLAGTLVQSATNEVSQWVLDRQKHSFDAVIVNPGAAVSVHLNEALHLDESDLHRKVRYAQSSKKVQRTLD